MFKKMFKNQRGLTLIELLAVVVILGIIAAIAIPAIGGMINNSKKDAHIANAQQIANAARLYVTTDTVDITNPIPMSKLVSENHIESIKDPEGTTAKPNYDETKTVVKVVKTNNVYSYFVTLSGARDYLTGATDASPINAKDLKRTNVK